jgi:hypothetical protein
MGLGLTGNLESFKSKLKDIFKKAYMTQLLDNQINLGDDNQETANNISDNAKESIEKAAQLFADSIGDELSSAIKDYICGANISITTTVPPTVTTVAGPVTGVIPPTSHTITIS